MVEHQHNECACLTQKDWVRWLFLVMQNLLADIAARDYFNFVFFL
jgi:hypothetical protein